MQGTTRYLSTYTGVHDTTQYSAMQYSVNMHASLYYLYYEYGMMLHATHQQCYNFKLKHLGLGHGLLLTLDTHFSKSNSLVHPISIYHPNGRLK
jgi:hypothetical protein